ncbi:MAG: CDP-glycerol glycerophosphotransferase family protein [Candidatus Marinimicrobia bacterium]|nr:CDP-glycerol glycerophosphotransferase family protein [Candidatus Neomarinimicrobiota bacterium]
MDKRIDFIFTTVKDLACLIPLREKMSELGWETNIVKIHKHKFRNNKRVKELAPYVVASYDVPLRRLKRHKNWTGKTIYVDHGVGPIKYYAYRYQLFHECDLLFYQGEVFKRKMEFINPDFKNGLMGGFTKIDQLLELKIDKNAYCEKYNLDPSLPIILFAPTWGGKASNHWGINNAKYLDGISNVIIAPHSNDYRYAKKFNAVIPEKGSNINEFIKLADIVISDVSSVIGEAAVINKPVIQIELPSYPGCFPNYDKRKDDSYIGEDIIDYEETHTDRLKRPFKIAYLDEDWIVGHTCKPENLQKTIDEVIMDPDKYIENRKYWAEQCCWRSDGHTNERMAEMIKIFADSGQLKQL